MPTSSVTGLIEAIALRHGSAGRFRGDIEGSYEGYRVGNPEDQEGAIEVANGTIAFVVQHLIAISRERGEDFFSGGKDPFEQPPPGGPPLPRGVPGDFRAGSTGPPSPGRPRFEKIRRLKITIDGAKSTGFYAGARGEMEITAPEHRETGYLVVATRQGSLRLDFCEWVEGGRIVADLRVDGANSTGAYWNATGDLKFALDVHPAGLGRGRYWGTIQYAPEQATKKPHTEQ